MERRANGADSAGDVRQAESRRCERERKRGCKALSLDHTSVRPRGARLSHETPRRCQPPPLPREARLRTREGGTLAIAAATASTPRAVDRGRLPRAASIRSDPERFRDLPGCEAWGDCRRGAKSRVKRYSPRKKSPIRWIGRFYEQPPAQGSSRWRPLLVRAVARRGRYRFARSLIQSHSWY